MILYVNTPRQLGVLGLSWSSRTVTQITIRKTNPIHFNSQHMNGLH